MDVKSRRRQESPFACLKPFIRLWGVSTAIVLFGVSVDILMHGYDAGLILLLSSGLVFFFEVKWVITLFLNLIFTRESSSCVQCWGLTSFFGSWRLSFPYVALGVALIMWPHNLWLSYVCGTQLLVLALLRMFTIFRIDGRSREDSLLPDFDDSSSDKYDQLSDGMEDVFVDNKMNTQITLEDEDALDPIDDI